MQRSTTLMVDVRAMRLKGRNQLHSSFQNADNDRRNLSLDARSCRPRFPLPE